MNIRVATVSALSAVLVAGGATAAVAAPAGHHQDRGRHRQLNLTAPGRNE
jgi:hypothetical protein